MRVSVSLLMPLFFNHFHLSSPAISSVCLINWPCRTFSFQFSLRSFALRSLYCFTVSFTSMSDLLAALNSRSLLSCTCLSSQIFDVSIISSMLISPLPPSFREIYSRSTLLFGWSALCIVISFLVRLSNS